MHAATGSDAQIYLAEASSADERRGWALHW